MLQSDPVSMKRIGDNVTNNDPGRETDWLKLKAKAVMKTAVYLKFSQNPNLLTELKSTTGQFVEANKHDSNWGVGLALQNVKTLDPDQWKGENWLGNILTDIREQCINGEVK